LSQPDRNDPAALAASAPGVFSAPGQARDAGGPVFAEPWEAQAFALAVQLSQAGWFTWKEWTEALSVKLRAADRDDPDDGTRYYQHWLAALEALVVARRLADPEALARRQEEWAAAYRATPHGQPVELRNARRDHG
jgi:nitrile hydratase accessory protein